MLKKNSWIVLILAIALFSCGYRFSGGGELPAGVKTVFLVIFNNRTSEIGVENDLAAALGNTFTTVGDKDMLVKNRQEADAELTGAINSVEIYTVSRRTETVSAERRVLITASARLVSKDGRTVWQQGAISVTQAYRVAGANQETEADRRNAIRDASVLLAQKIYNNMTSNF